MIRKSGRPRVVPRVLALPLFLLVALLSAAEAGADTAAAESPAGTADGWLEVARERTLFRHAWVMGESGDGASDALRVVLSDRELAADALDSAEIRDALAAEDRVRSVVALLPGEGAEIELAFHHPRLPAGLSLNGLARFVPESVSAARLEGRLLLAGPSPMEVWFSAPIERRDRNATLGQEPPADRPAMPLDEAIRSGGEEEFEAALANTASIEADAGGGMTVLAVAADSGNLYAVRRLLESGASVDGRADRSAMSALMLAAGKNDGTVLEALLAAGANPKLRTSGGHTAILGAVFAGEVENVRRLIAAGADVARDRELLLRVAAEKNVPEITALLEAASVPPAP